MHRHGMFFWHGKAQASAMQQQVETHLQQVQPVQVIQFLYLSEKGVLAWGRCHQRKGVL